MARIIIALLATYALLVFVIGTAFWTDPDGPDEWWEGYAFVALGILFLAVVAAVFLGMGWLWEWAV